MNNDINNTRDTDTDELQTERNRSVTGTQQRSEFGDIGTDDELGDVEEDESTRSETGAGE